MSALDVKKHGGLGRSWRLSCRALLSVFWLGVAIQLNAQHVECGGWRDNALPKLLNAPGALVAAMGSKVRPAPSELSEHGCESWAVVHHIPAIGEDDGDAVGRLGVVAGDAHGSIIVGVDWLQFGWPSVAVKSSGPSVTAATLCGKSTLEADWREGDVFAGAMLALSAEDCVWHAGGFGLCGHGIVGGLEMDCGVGGLGYDRLVIVDGTLPSTDARPFAVNNLEEVGLAKHRHQAHINGLVAIDGQVAEDCGVAREDCGEGGGGHLVWAVGLAVVAQLRSIYTVSVWRQEKSTLFLCSPKSRIFSPLNSGVDARRGKTPNPSDG